MTRKTIFVCDQCGTDYMPTTKEGSLDNSIYSFIGTIDCKKIDGADGRDFCSPECLRTYVAKFLGIEITVTASEMKPNSGYDLARARHLINEIRNAPLHPTPEVRIWLADLENALGAKGESETQ